MASAPGSPLRVVLDTNVYVSAFTHPEGPPFHLWQAALRGGFRLLISPAILGELGRVLRRAFGWEEEMVRRQAKLLVRAAEIVSPTTAVSAIREDPADNRILECAIDGGAHLIVSGDRHLRRLKAYRNIPIVAVSDAVRIVGAAE